MSQVETKFSKIAGLIAQMESYQNKMYGITNSGDCWEWYLSRWKKLSGKLSHISVGYSGVWGIDNKNNVFLLDEKTSTFIVEPSIKLKSISSNSEVLGIGLDNYPYKWNGKSFDLISSDLKSRNITITKSSKIYSLSLESIPFEYENSKWNSMEGKKFKTLLVDEDILCGVALDSSIWHYKDSKWISELNGKEISIEKKELDLTQKESPKVTTITSPENKVERKKESFTIKSSSTQEIQDNSEQPKTLKKKGFSLVIQKEKCLSCSKTVYANEKITADGKIYHQKCFRCKHCNCKLTFSNFSQLDNVPYCKTHLVELFRRQGKYNFSGKESKSQELAGHEEHVVNSEDKNKENEKKKEENEKIEAKRIETERLEKKEQEEKLKAERLEAEKREQERLEKKEAEKREQERIENERLEAEKVETERLEAERIENEKKESDRVEAEKKEIERIENEKKNIEILPKSKPKPSRLSALEEIEEEDEDDDEDLIIEEIDDHQFTDDLKLYEMFHDNINSDHEEEEEEEEEVIVKPKKVKKKKEIEPVDENLIIHVVKSEDVNQEPIGKDGIEKGLAAEIEVSDEDNEYPTLPVEFRDIILSKEDEKRMTKYKKYFERGILDDEEYLEKVEEMYSKYENKDSIENGNDMQIEEDIDEMKQDVIIEDDDEDLVLPTLPQKYENIKLSYEDEEKLKKYQSYFQKEILDDEEYLEKVDEIYSKY
eukprot:gene12410-6077_t